MSELIVLGLIPGTQIQITFILWVLLTAGLLASMLEWLGHRRRAFRSWLITLSLLTITRNATPRS
jgi:DMSO reductase anchor subunit